MACAQRHLHIVSLCVSLLNTMQVPLQAQEAIATFGLRAQVIQARGIHLLVELCWYSKTRIHQPAIAALHHLTLTERSFMGILMQATQDDRLLAAIASGRPDPVVSFVVCCTR